MKQKYTTAYMPTMPTLDIRLSQSNDSLWSGPLRAIVDSGSDGTLVPDVLNKLRLLLDGPAQTTEILEPKTKRK